MGSQCKNVVEDGRVAPGGGAEFGAWRRRRRGGGRDC